MNNLKKIRKAKFDKAKDYLDNSQLGMNLPVYSLFESGKALLIPKDMEIVCNELQTTKDAIYDNAEDYSCYVSSGAVKTAQALYVVPKEPTDEEKQEITKQAFAITCDKFAMLPQANQKRQFRMAENDWRELNAQLHRMGYSSVKQYLVKTVLNQVKKQAI